LMVKKLRADEGGITPVLGAMFILGIVIALSSTFLATWGPSEMNRRAREHMEEVNESFRELRAVIEGLRVGESKTVSFRMGPDPVPFVPSPRVGGTLSATPTPTPPPASPSYWGNYWENYWENNPGNIRFDMENQSWIYEMGMIILIQDNVVLMDSAPRMLTVWEAGGNQIGVYVDVIKVRGLGSSMSGRGTSTIAVSILRRFENEKENRENAVIKINSMYRNAWREYLASENQRLNAKGYRASFNENTLTLAIQGKDNTPGVKDIIYYQKVTEIWVSIS